METEPKAFEKVKTEAERLIGVFHKSIVPYSVSLCVAVVLAFVPLVGAILIPEVISFGTAMLLGLVILALLGGRVWFLWKRSIIFVTNLRVIVLQQNGLFSHDNTEVYLADVCNVAVKVKGMSETLFHFGDVLIQTELEYWVRDIENPHEMKELIFEAMHFRKDVPVQTLPKRFWKKGNPQKKTTIRVLEP